MTVDADRYWADVPSVTDEPDPGERRRPAFSAPSRRTVFKSIGVLGGALALNVLSALPGKNNGAYAVVGNEYTDCAGYGSAAGYDNNTKVCVGAPYSRSYCGGDGWFLRSSGTCYNSYAVKLCGAGSLTDRNAWRWTHSGTKYRCADGYVATCGGTTFYICSYAL
ncbi:hypothetical protein [Nonomuraea gerenzanensis]|uniref:Uncharacterized protein n=1 Tax=Nonomuraea gerenzanensis TaxID=93944 RepID=A0A1M4E5N3_9ACTN|nr:hypothetical protein [Nonomuraea gerenzanensis]UBU16254.1 hypothetical protein LCN96_14930 [Nonomuraea gerenzanensis]SBO94068.1 hypothetical protein BN4615_P3584 [Nonomuraea gerenzanensis]